jgi:hypothetical protein
MPPYDDTFVDRFLEPWNQASISPAVLALRVVICSPRTRAASVRSRMFSAVERLAGLTSSAIRTAFGTRSCSRPSRLATSTVTNMLTPVAFPPGLARLATRPNLTGSSPTPKTTGIVAVAALAARDALLPAGVAITAT